MACVDHGRCRGNDHVDRGSPTNIQGQGGGVARDRSPALTPSGKALKHPPRPRAREAYQTEKSVTREKWPFQGIRKGQISRVKALKPLSSRSFAGNGPSKRHSAASERELSPLRAAADRVTASHLTPATQRNALAKVIPAIGALLHPPTPNRACGVRAPRRRGLSPRVDRRTTHAAARRAKFRTASSRGPPTGAAPYRE